MDPIARRLADRFRVVSVDLRGHGESDKPDADYEQATVARDVAGALDALGVAACCVVMSGGAE